MCSNVFEEVEERFAHPSVRVHHERDELLMHRRSHSFVLVVLIGLANPEWVTVGDRVSLAGLRLACVVGCVAHDVGDGDVCEDCDAGVSQAVDSDVWAQVVGAAVPVRGAWYLADGLGERGCPVGDQGLVCDVRGVGKALAAVPEGQVDASAGDFVSHACLLACLISYDIINY